MADAKNSGGIFFTDPSTKEEETDFDFTGTAILSGYRLVADAGASSKLYIGGANAFSTTVSKACPF